MELNLKGCLELVLDFGLGLWVLVFRMSGFSLLWPLCLWFLWGEDNKNRFTNCIACEEDCPALHLDTLVTLPLASLWHCPTVGGFSFCRPVGFCLKCVWPLTTLASLPLAFIVHYQAQQC